MRYPLYNLISGAALLLTTWTKPVAPAARDAMLLAQSRAQQDNVSVADAMRKNFRETIIGMVLATVLSLMLLLSVTLIVLRNFEQGADLPGWVYLMACGPTVLLLSAYFLEQKLRPAVQG